MKIKFAKYILKVYKNQTEEIYMIIIDLDDSAFKFIDTSLVNTQMYIETVNATTCIIN